MEQTVKRFHKSKKNKASPFFLPPAQPPTRQFPSSKMQTTLRISASPALVGARAPARKASPSAVRFLKRRIDNFVDPFDFSSSTKVERVMPFIKWET